VLSEVDKVCGSVFNHPAVLRTFLFVKLENSEKNLPLFPLHVLEFSGQLGPIIA